MSDFSPNTPIMQPEAKPGPAGWVSIWINAVTKPNEQTFVDISKSPEAKIQTALIWAAIAGLITGLATGIGTSISTLIQSGFDTSGMGRILGFLCGMPIGFAILTPLFLSLSTALFQAVAKMFGGTGSFEKLLYSLAAISMPVTVVSGVISLFSSIPILGVCVSFLSIPLSFYTIFLNVTAVKAVNRFDWGKAVASVLIPSLVIGFFCGCLVFAGMMIMGPAISNAFNGINQGLQVP